MRPLVVSLILLALAAPAGVGAGSSATGSLQVVEARGTVKITARGAVIGKLDRGQLQIVDLSPNDQWSPRVNGVPRGKVVGLRGRDVNFFVPGGRYRLVVRGEGINLSARGEGLATLDGEPGPTGEAGTYAVGDDLPEPLPDHSERVIFGAEQEEPPQPTKRPA